MFNLEVEVCPCERNMEVVEEGDNGRGRRRSSHGKGNPGSITNNSDMHPVSHSQHGRISFTSVWRFPWTHDRFDDAGINENKRWWKYRFYVDVDVVVFFSVLDLGLTGHGWTTSEWFWWRVPSRYTTCSKWHSWNRQELQGWNISTDARPSIVFQVRTTVFMQDKWVSLGTRHEIVWHRFRGVSGTTVRTSFASVTSLVSGQPVSNTVGYRSTEFWTQRSSVNRVSNTVGYQELWTQWGISQQSFKHSGLSVNRDLNTVDYRSTELSNTVGYRSTEISNTVSYQSTELWTQWGIGQQNFQTQLAIGQQSFQTQWNIGHQRFEHSGLSVNRVLNKVGYRSTDLSNTVGLSVDRTLNTVGYRSTKVSNTVV